MWVHFKKPRKFLVKETYLGEPNERIEFRTPKITLMHLSKAINDESFDNEVAQKMFEYFGTSDLREWPKCPQTADNFVMELDLDVKIKGIKITDHDGPTIIEDQTQWEKLPF